MRTAEDIAALMASFAASPCAQVRQTAYRLELARHWSIAPGARLLEIGCGQGDTTAVLAEVVGEHGRVVGIDPASPDYGAPVTLGRSAQHLRDGPYAHIVDIRLNFADWSTLEGSFDGVVLSHCSWYFEGLERLVNTLTRARSKADRLYFAEWSVVPLHPQQIPHFCSVTAQSLVSRLRPDLDLNIRHPCSEPVLMDALIAAGWTIESRRVIERPDLDDGHWEVQKLFRLAETPTLRLPPGVRMWLKEQAAIAKSFPAPYAALPALSYVCAGRSGSTLR